MLPTDLAVFEQTISKPRLNSYRSYFNADLREAVGLYMWNTEVSSTLRALLSYFEIALRNNIHKELSQRLLGHPSAAWYATMSANFKPETRRQIQKWTHDKNGAPRTPAPAPDTVVSNLTFGCWLPIMKAIQHDRHSIFPSIFPGHPLNSTPNEWRRNVARDGALRFIEELNTARNRIGHHEPVWKFAAIKDTSGPGPAVLIAPASTNQADSLARLHRLLVLFDDGLAWVNRDLAADLSKSSWREQLGFLLTDRGIARYRQMRHVPKSSRMSPAAFRKNFGLVSRANRPVVLAGSQGRGIYYP